MVSIEPLSERGSDFRTESSDADTLGIVRVSVWTLLSSDLASRSFPVSVLELVSEK